MLYSSRKILVSFYAYPTPRGGILIHDVGNYASFSSYSKKCHAVYRRRRPSLGCGFSTYIPSLQCVIQGRYFQNCCLKQRHFFRKTRSRIEYPNLAKRNLPLICIWMRKKDSMSQYKKRYKLGNEKNFRWGICLRFGGIYCPV